MRRPGRTASRRSKPEPKLRLGDSRRVDPAQVKALFRAAGWTEDVARYSPRRIQKLLHHSSFVLTAWDDKALVGFASAVSDGVLCGLVENLVVHPRYRHRGLGTRLLRRLARSMQRQRISCLYALGNRGQRVRAFFRRSGFRPLDWKIFVRLSH